MTLYNVPTTTLMGLSISMALSKGNLDECAQMIFDWSCDNLKSTIEVLGYDVLNEVLNYLIEKQ